MQNDITNDPTDSRALSVAEAARALGISSEAVRMRLRRGSLDGFRDDGGRWRVRLAVATDQMTELDRTTDPTTAQGAVRTMASRAPSEALERDKADLQAERDRLLTLLETALAERRNQPPTVLSSLRRLMATLTDWVIERLRSRGDEGDTAA